MEEVGTIRAVMESAPDRHEVPTSWCLKHGRLELVHHVLGFAGFAVADLEDLGGQLGQRMVLTGRQAAEVRRTLLGTIRAVMESAPDRHEVPTSWCLKHGRLELVHHVLGFAGFAVADLEDLGGQLGQRMVLTGREAAEVRCTLSCGCSKTFVGGPQWIR